MSLSPFLSTEARKTCAPFTALPLSTSILLSHPFSCLIGKEMNTEGSQVEKTDARCAVNLNANNVRVFNKWQTLWSTFLLSFTLSLSLSLSLCIHLVFTKLHLCLPLSVHLPLPYHAQTDTSQIRPSYQKSLLWFDSCVKSDPLSCVGDSIQWLNDWMIDVLCSQFHLTLCLFCASTSV